MYLYIYLLQNNFDDLKGLPFELVNFPSGNGVGLVLPNIKR